MPGPRLVDLGNPVADHPLNYGLVAWWLPLPNTSGGPTLFNLVRQSGYDCAAGAGSYWEATPYGLGVRDAGTTRAANTGGWVWETAAEPNRTFSLVADLVCRPGGTHPNTGIIFSAGGNDLSFRMTSSTALDLIDSQVALVASATIPAVTSGDRGMAGLTIDGSGNYAMYWDGVSVATGSTAADFTNGTQAYTAWLFDANSSLNREYGNHTLLSGWYYAARVLTSTDMWALYEQSLRGHPDTLRRYTPRAWVFGGTAPAGGGNRRRRVLLCGGG